MSIGNSGSVGRGKSFKKLTYKGSNMKGIMEKYLMIEKVSEKEAVEKVTKVIRSSKTEDQLKVAAKMVARFIKMYGESFYSKMVGSDDWPPRGAKFRMFHKIIDDQKDRIQHVDNYKKNKKG